jgi:hypothetical protein
LQIEMSLSTEEMACIYAALILVDDDVAVTGDKIASLLKVRPGCAGSHSLSTSVADGQDRGGTFLAGPVR